MLAALLAPAVSAAREYLQLFVTEPYLELHTGPGRGYPVFHVVPRDGSVDVLFRRTDWFKVRTEQGVEGWASQTDMQKTVLADGSRFHFDLGDRAGFTSHRYEMGMFAGQYGGATLRLRLHLLLLQLAARRSRASRRAVPRQVLERRDRRHRLRARVRARGALVAVPHPRARPGAHRAEGDPGAAADRTEQTAYVGGGVRFYLTRRFFLRAEYKAHFIFTKRNQNEDEDEWKLGFAFFF